jgi:hypothetical protein
VGAEEKSVSSSPWVCRPKAELVEMDLAEGSTCSRERKPEEERALELSKAVMVCAVDQVKAAALLAYCSTAQGLAGQMQRSGGQQARSRRDFSIGPEGFRELVPSIARTKAAVGTSDGFSDAVMHAESILSRPAERRLRRVRSSIVSVDARREIQALGLPIVCE